MPIKTTLLSFAILIGLSMQPAALQAETYAGPEWWLKDAGAVISSPLHWGASDLKNIGIFSLAAGISFVWFDDNLEDYAKNVQGNEFNVLSEKVRYLGDGLIIVPLFGAGYAYGAAAGKSELQRASLIGLESYLVSGGIATLVKFSVHRPRPKTGGSYFRTSKERFFSPDNLSFPSGHSTSAFSSARVFSWYFRDYAAAPYISYGLASLVAWSRVNDSEHWASDVVVGSALGFFTAGKIIELNENRSPPNLSLLPAYASGPGVTVLYKF